jgi:WD40 repeat protein
LKSLLSRWNLETGEVTEVVKQIPLARGLAFSPDGRFAAVAGGLDVTVLDLEKNRRQVLKRKVPRETHGICFSADGKWLVHTEGLEVVLWEVGSWQEKRTFSLPKVLLLAIAISPDGKFLATNGEEKTIQLWEIETGRRYATLPGHREPTHRLVFSPDGKRLFSGSKGPSGTGQAGLWDVASGKEVAVFDRLESNVYRAAFAPDGKYLITSGAQGTLRWWNIDGVPNPEP